MSEKPELLKKCPFCTLTKYLMVAEHSRVWYVYCGKCGACGPIAANGDDAIDKWHRREDEDGKA